MSASNPSSTAPTPTAPASTTPASPASTTPASTNTASTSPIPAVAASSNADDPCSALRGHGDKSPATTEAATSTAPDISAEVKVPTLELLDRDPITYESTLATDKNMIHEAGYVAATKALYKGLWGEKRTIEALIRHHLGLGSRDVCVVARPLHWLRGGFNVCVPIEVRSPDSCRRLILRCAMPHKVAEAKYPGSADEKTASEVGTYVWMQEKCPDIPIPHLYAFGFSDHRHFTHEIYRPWYIRVTYHLRRLFYGLIGRPGLLSHYTSHPSTHRLATAYMLLENVSSDTSQMLSRTWEKQRGDPARRQRLFRGMARIMLSLARIPQPRIASFLFYGDGTVTLTNRPLTCTIMLLENDGTPRTVQRSDTYLCTEPYVADLFRFHDRRFLSHPNAAFDDKDCRSEMAAKTLLRAVAHQYIRQDLRNGPFILQLTDLHACNIFVDDEWNVTSLVDLEWVCALPAENLTTPYWLTGRYIDEIKGEHLTEYEKVHDEFLAVFDDEERKVAAEHGLSLTQIMREAWESGGVWFWRSIRSTNAMEPLVAQHICPRFTPRLLFREERLLSSFWSQDAAKVIESKVEAYRRYQEDLKCLFC